MASFALFGRKNVRVHFEEHVALTTPVAGEPGSRMQRQAATLRVWGIQTTAADGKVTSWSHMVGAGIGSVEDEVEPQVEPETPASEETVEETTPVAEESATEPTPEVPTEEPSVPEQVAPAPTSDPEDDLPEPEDGGWYS